MLGRGNDAVIEGLRERKLLVHEVTLNHKYPYDWRTKKPVILRATAQWFGDLRVLKEDARRALANVHVGTMVEYTQTPCRYLGTNSLTFYFPQSTRHSPPLAEVVLRPRSLVEMIGALAARGLGGFPFQSSTIEIQASLS